MSTGTDVTGKTRAQELADRFDADNAEVVRFVQTCTDEQWNCVTTAEGWTVPATAMHIATGHLIIPPWVHRIATGLPVTETWDDFATFNTLDQEKNARATRDDILDRLGTFGASASLFVRGLTDEELARSARFEPADADLTAEQVIEAVLIHHIQEHFESIRAVTG
ncbi:DinB family protein [Geodermatophilus sp. SYSU D00079]